MTARFTLIPSREEIAAEMTKHVEAAAGDMMLLAELTADAFGIDRTDTIVDVAFQVFSPTVFEQVFSPTVFE